MFVTALLYVVAILAVTLVAPLAGVPMMPLLLVARRNKGLAPAATGLLAMLSMALGLLGFLWVARLLQRDPSVWMFLLPFVLVVRNDLDRLRRAWVGQTGIKDHLERHGEAYDPHLQARMEVGSLVGDVIGLWGVYLLWGSSMIYVVIACLVIGGFWLRAYLGGNPRFWHVVGEHPEAAYRRFLQDPAWIILQPGDGTSPPDRTAHVGPFTIFVPAGGGARVKLYCRADQIDASQAALLADWDAKRFP